MTAAAATSGPAGLAGRPGWSSSPAAMALWLIIVVLFFVVFALVARSRRRREEPLLAQMRTRPLTYRAQVSVKASTFGSMTAQRGPLYLNVYGDLFRVFHPFPLARLVFGQDYSYWGPDTVIEVVPGLLHDWIEISGPPSGSATRIQIARRKRNGELWDVLLSTGARPAGPPL